MAQASGVQKQLVIAKQSAQGTIAAADAATKRYLRRVTSSLDLKKASYQSNEINTNRQISEFRHGVISVDGSISGELSTDTYNLLMAGILHKDWVAAPVGGPESDVVAAVVSGNIGTFTSAATATFLQDGLKVGDVGRWTGHTGDGAGNNTRNFLITSLTDLVMTGLMLDGSPVIAAAASAAATFTGVGKKTWTPTASHTEDWFTFEHYFSDLDLSETFWDCKPNTMAVRCPGSGIATIDFGILGLRHTDYATGSSPYFTSPAAAATDGVLAAANGAIYVAGSAVAIVTGFDFTVSAGLSLPDGAVGTNILPDVFDGRIAVSGNLSLYFTDMTFLNYFENETEVSIVLALTAGTSATSEVMSFTFPRCKLGGASKDDGEKGIVQSCPFTALFYNTTTADSGVTATNSLATTMSVQDSSIS